MKPLYLTRALVSAALAATASCGADAATPDAAPTVDAGPDAAPDQVIDNTHPIVAGSLIEGEWTAGPTDRIFVRVTGTSPFGWNIHGHDNGRTQIIVEEFDQTEAMTTFVPSAQGDWFLLIANQGAVPIDVTVHMELYGAATWSGFE